MSAGPEWELVERPLLDHLASLDWEPLMPGYDLQKANLATIGKSVWLDAVAAGSALVPASGA